MATAATGFGIIAIIGVFVVLAIIAAIIVAIVLSAKKSDEEIPTNGDSYFDGSTIQRIGWSLLTNFITTITLGIAYPWAVCMMTRWETKHTVINGRRLKFTGNGAQLFGKYILWWFLTIITLGIYSIWLGVKMEQWKVKHTVYADGKLQYESRFTSGAGGWFVNHFIFGLLVFFTFGIATPWAQVRLMKWKAKNTVIGGSPLVFGGRGGSLFVKNLVLVLLTPFTLGIYALCYPVVLLKWQYKNTEALYRTAPIVSLSRAHEADAIRDYAKIRLAANDTEVAMVKSGFTGKETDEELESLIANGNAFAMFELSKRLNNAEGDTSRSLSLLENASNGGYYAAMYEYSRQVSDVDKRMFLLEDAAKRGSTLAPWQLKQIFLEKSLNADKDSQIAMLTKAAYWFKVSIELEIAEAVAAKAEYEAILERLAIMHCNAKPVEKENNSLIFIILAAVLGVVLIIGLVVAAIFGFNFKISNKRPTSDYTENELTRPLHVYHGSSEFCKVSQGELVREDSSKYQNFDYSEGVKNEYIEFSSSTHLNWSYYLGDEARYDAESKKLYVDFGVAPESQLTVGGSSMDFSAYLVCEDVTKNDGTSPKVLSPVVRPGEKITEVDCDFPIDVENSRFHVIIVNSCYPMTEPTSNLWVFEACEKVIQIVHDRNDDISQEESNEVSNDTPEDPSGNDEPPYTGFRYDFGVVIDNPTQADFDVFYNMVKNNEYLWNSRNNFNIVTGDYGNYELMRGYIIDDVGAGLFDAYGFDFFQEYYGGFDEYEITKCRYYLHDVEWVYKAIFGIDSMRVQGSEDWWYDGEYLCRTAPEMHMGYAGDIILSFEPEQAHIGNNVYRFTIDMSSRFEFDEEDVRPTYRHLVIEAVPMHSQNFGVYWRLVSVNVDYIQ